MIIITVWTPEHEVLEVKKFDSFTEAMDFAYSNDWDLSQVDVTFVTYGNFYHTIPLTDFTQPKNYVA